MKKLFTFILCAVITIAARAQFSGSGNGTESDPYLIYNETQLYQMSNYLNKDGVVFKLMKDLDLTEFISENFPSEGWTPVGVESSHFKGKFYGNNHTISGLFINKSSINYVGFFGYIENATIQDLKLKGSTIKGGSYSGSLCGRATSSTVSNCSVVLTSLVDTKTYSGGLIGYISSTTISNSSFQANSVSGGKYSGGFVGYASSSSQIKNNSTKAAYTSKSASSCGGFCGYSVSSTFQNCTSEGNVSGGTDKLGGFAGEIEATNFTNCSSNGNITGKTNVGGIVGSVSTTCQLNSCHSVGNISGTTSVAGIAGTLNAGSSVSFSSCHHKGNITNTGERTGGIVATSNGVAINSMGNCSHFGDITGTKYVGGLIGEIIKSDDKPTLHRYTLAYNSDNEHSGNYYTTVQEAITSYNGGLTTKSINNCTSIGNLSGSSFVGGLIGEDVPSYSYQGTQRILWSYNNNYYNLFKDGVYQGDASYDSSERKYYVTYYDYKRCYTSISLINSYFSGTIEGTEYVGGIAGHKVTGNITNCYVNSLSITGNDKVGGLVGSIEGESSTSHLTLKSNVAITNSISATVDNVGRIYGHKNNDYVTIGALASAQGNRALTTTKVIKKGVVQEITDDLQNGNVMGKSLLRLKANYVALGWNFDSNWDILETECYPYKKYQAAPPVIESNLISQDTEISGSSLNGGTVYLYYKDREAVSTTCDGHTWTFATEALQSGAAVQLYADVEGMTPSYLTSTNVGYPGSGTEEDPYRIYTAEDLQGASNKGYYKLMNDIDLTAWINENSPTEGWVAIGRNSGEATYINGDGHKITGLWINTTQDYTGLFSNFSAGIIKNLTVEVASGKKVKGGDYTGILIGRNANGQLLNCTVKGEVEGTVHVGGVTGYSANNTVNAVTFEGKVTTTSASAYVGGFAGLSENDAITAVHAYPIISASGATCYVGGAIGYMSSGTITKSHAENSLTATGQNCYVGGLIGYNKAAITMSYTVGNISSTGSGENSYTGGITGYSTAAISDCYSTTEVIGKYYVGGICAYTKSTIDRCYAKGDVYGSRYGGGVVAQLDGTASSLTNSVAACNKLELTDQSSWGCRVIGGFKNGAAEPDNSNYALSTMQVSLNGVAQKKTDDAVEGIAKPASELMSAQTYIDLGWDYNDVWGIDEGQMYPYLLWEVDLQPVADITLDKTTAVLAVGNSLTLSANIQPLSATNKRLTWTSSKTSVATVEDGIITAIAVGEATITATTTDGSNLSATCKVTVVANHDEAIAELQTLVDQAQALYDNSTEGENIGQYAPGSRAALLAVIKAVKAKISSTMSESDITECTTQITNAINAFKAQQVSAGEDTDVTLYDDIIYVNPVECGPGQQVTLSLQMNNLKSFVGYQCDLTLPNGMTFAKDEDNFYMAEMSLERTTTKKTDYFNVELQSDGALRFLCSSSKKYAFDGNEGEVATVTINIPADIEDGDYPLILTNVVMTDDAGKTTEVSYVKTTLTVTAFTLGDANGDGSVNVGDFAATAAYILGPDVPEGFVEKAADANCDTKINVGDLAAIAAIILGPGANAAPQRADEAEATAEMTMELTASETTGEYLLYVGINNVALPFSGYQFDLVLPQGLTVKTDEDGFYEASLCEDRTNGRRTDYFNSALQSDGALRVLCASTQNAMFEGETGHVAAIKLAAKDSQTQGAIELKSAMLTNGGDVTSLDDTLIMFDHSVTNIEQLRNEQSIRVYDLNGQLIRYGKNSEECLKDMPHGVYVVNGVKVVL